jgi:hypothetical protein
VTAVRGVSVVLSRPRARAAIFAIRLIADKRVGETAEIEQAVPIGIVARGSAHFEAEHDVDMSEHDFCGETGEAAALNDAGAGQAEVFIDHDVPFRRPAKSLVTTAY